MVISVEQLVYEYPGQRALDNISLTIPQGSITALVGPNGAGKTTLMRCIAALSLPFSGQVTVDGLNTHQHPREVHQRLGYLSDFFGLYDELTVRQCLIYMARSRLIPEADVPKRVDATAEMLHLTDRLEQKAGQLSRGWRQRLGIAQSIIHRPKVVLLDEPASGLDPEARHQLSSLFLKLRNEGMTLVVSSHILSELEDYCTAMVILRDGRIVEQNTTDAVQARTLSLSIELAEEAAPHQHTLTTMDGVSNVTADGHQLHCQFVGDNKAQAGLLKALINAKLPIIAFSPVKQRMQDIYMSHSQEAHHDA